MAYPYKLFRRPSKDRLVEHQEPYPRAVPSLQKSTLIALADIVDKGEHAVVYLEICPRFCSHALYDWLELPQSKKIYVGILLLVMSLVTFGKLESAERVVMGWQSINPWIFFIALLYLVSVLVT